MNTGIGFLLYIVVGGLETRGDRSASILRLFFSKIDPKETAKVKQANYREIMQVFLLSLLLGKISGEIGEEKDSGGNDPAAQKPPNPEEELSEQEKFAQELLRPD